MRRRRFLLGALGAGVAAATGGWALRPDDAGAPHEAYFAALNDELKRNGPMRPCIVIDLDRLDHNIAVLRRGIPPSKRFRVVAKSLPAIPLLDYIFRKAETRRLMAFHQPLLKLEAEAFPDADVLLGKPLPARSAALFYERLKGRFDPARQLQWLVDTPERLAQYLELAQGRELRLRVNIELDVGLHRGGVQGEADLERMLGFIAAHPQRLEFAGFMGYDPHVVKLPRMLGTPEELLGRVMRTYQGHVDYARRAHPALWREDLTLNTAGSPTYPLHRDETLSNDISVGSALVKPTDFDLPTLAEHRPAAYIATPVLKSTGPIELPGLDEMSGALSWWDANQRQTHFIYGGNWMARYESPRGLRRNEIYGHSSNQEIVNASAAAGLRVDDQVFLRPTQSEAVLLQFGDLVAVRGGRIQEYWPVLNQGA